MPSSIDYGDYRVDEYSQQILQRLYESGDEEKTTILQEAADLDDGKKARYRLNEHLIPSGLVREVPSEETQARQFKITASGSEFVENQLDETSSDPDHGRKKAEEAIDVAVSAVDAIEETKERVDQLGKDVERVRRTARNAQQAANSNSKDKEEVTPRQLGKVKKEAAQERSHLESRLDSQVSTVQSNLARTKRKVDDLEQEVQSLPPEITTLRNDIQEIDAQLTDLSERIEQIESASRQDMVRSTLLGTLSLTASWIWTLLSVPVIISRLVYRLTPRMTRNRIIFLVLISAVVALYTYGLVHQLQHSTLLNDGFGILGCCRNDSLLTIV